MPEIVPFVDMVVRHVLFAFGQIHIAVWMLLVLLWGITAAAKLCKMAVQYNSMKTLLQELRDSNLSKLNNAVCSRGRIPQTLK